jgi:hypothetical protein
MSDQEINPYAAPQAELSSSSSSIPLAQEVFQRQLFPEVSTKDLDRVANASSSIKTLDLIYLLPSVLGVVACIVVLYQAAHNENWDMTYKAFMWMIIVCLITFYINIVSLRQAKSRKMGLILDGMLVLIAAFCCLFTAFVFHPLAALLMIFVGAFPALGFKYRYQFPVLYGPDRIVHEELLVELLYRRKHCID